MTLFWALSDAVLCEAKAVDGDVVLAVFGQSAVCFCKAIAGGAASVSVRGCVLCDAGFARRY